MNNWLVICYDKFDCIVKVIQHELQDNKEEALQLEKVDQHLFVGLYKLVQSKFEA